MKKTFALAAAGTLLLAGTASGVDIVIDVPTFGPLTSGQSHVYQFNVTDPGLAVIGFSFGGFFDTAEFSWASDTNLLITSPTGQTWAVGGFGSPSDEDWDFQGGGSEPSAFYFHGPSAGIAGFDLGGLWTLQFTQDFGTLNSLSDGQFTIHLIPAPGALALLGMAGLVGVRRRRRE